VGPKDLVPVEPCSVERAEIVVRTSPEEARIVSVSQRCLTTPQVLAGKRWLLAEQFCFLDTLERHHPGRSIILKPVTLSCPLVQGRAVPKS
jgi:hypothetical protein